MNDKLLFENWRKFLKEAPEDQWFFDQEMEQRIADEKAKAAAEAERKAGCVTIGELEATVAEMRRLHGDRAIKAARAERAANPEGDWGDRLVSYILDTALALKSGGAVTFAQAIYKAVKDNHDRTKNNYLSQEDFLEANPFMDKFDLHHNFKNFVNPMALEGALEEWWLAIQKWLEGLDPDICIDELNSPQYVNQVVDVNKFVGDKLGFCWAEHEYEGTMSEHMNRWRKFLKEEKLIKEDMGDYYDTLSEDDLYDLDIEELLDLRDWIEDFGGPGPQSDPKDLYPTIMARIEALEDEEDHGPPPNREIEGLYDGEFAMKLLKMFFSSANAGIELASMIPGAESLSKEFRRIRDHVPRLIKYAEDGDNYPWANIDETEDHPDVLTNDVRMLLIQMIGTEFEGEMDEEQKEVIAGYHNWVDSIANLRDYAYYNLHPKTPAQRSSMQQQYHRSLPSMGFEKYEHAYEFISKWVGGEIE